MEKERNYTIDFFRIIFMLIICITHMQGALQVYYMKNGWLGVEFFFILSGYYLYKSYQKNKEKSSIEYTKDRVKKMYPHYIFSFIVIFIISAIRAKYRNELDIVQMGFSGFSEIFMMQKIGVFENGINYPLWYLSVLLFSGLIIFELLKQNKNLFLNVITPLTLVFYFSFLSSNDLNIETWKAVNGIYIPLLRGFVNMGIGCMLANFIDIYKENLDRLYSNKKYLCYMLEIVNYIILFYIICFDTNYNNYAILSCSLLILFAQQNESICTKLFNRKWLKIWPDITYAMFLNHAAIIIVLAILIPRIPFLANLNAAFIMIGYLIILVIYSILTDKLIKFLIDNRKVHKNGKRYLW